MAVTNLYQYYTGKGQSLPSISKRAKLYSNYGLGSGYSGTAAQNTRLLQALQGGRPAPNANYGYTMSAPNYPNVSDALTKYAKQRSKEQEELLARQKAEEETQFKSYEEQIAGQEKLPDVYTRLSAEAGMPELQQQIDIYKGEIYKIKDLLDRLNEDITSRTQGSFTTEAQRRRQVAAEEEPLQTQLSRMGTALTPFLERQTAAGQEIGTMLGLTAEQQQKELLPTEARINALSDRFAREMTGFKENKETELTALVDKLERQRELADREWQRLQDLEKERREFQRQKELLALEHKYSMRSAAAGRSASNASQMQQIKSNLGASIINFFSDPKQYKGGFKTEKSLIPQLEAIYKPYGISRSDITALVYPMRKQMLGY